MTFLEEFRGSGPLRDVTVLDFSQMMMGPIATQLIGDLGALVIKVERPGSGEWERSYLPRDQRVSGESPYFLAMNRNKIGLAADLKDPGHLRRLLALVPHVDAVVHNFRPGVMERLGLGYEQLRELNPRLVYASGSGYGPSGPWAERPGQDLLAQSVSGLAADNGPGDAAPVPSATPVVDASSGFLLAFHVVAGILGARRTGAGQQVEASLLGTALLMQCQQAFVTLNTDLRYHRSDNGIVAPWTNAPYGVFPTSDSYLTLSMVTPARLSEVLDIPADLADLASSEAFAARDDIVACISPQLRTRTTGAWLAVMLEHDIWAAPLLTLEEALAHPQVTANGYVEQVSAPDGSTVHAVGLGCTVSSIPRVNRLPPPRLGEHTDLVWQAVEHLNEAPGGSQGEKFGDQQIGLGG